MACKQGPQLGNPLYYIRSSEQFIAVCDACFGQLAARPRENAPDALLAAWERLADELLRDLQ
jgi:hypothetical protein